MNNNETKRRLGALDVFIILLVLACVAFLALRSFYIKESNVGEKSVLEDYVVSFKISDIRDSSAKNYLEPGTNFYLKETNTLFGTLREGVTVSDSLKYYELASGEIVAVRNTGTGSLYRVDAEGSFTVKGWIDANGSFMLDGNKFIGLNKEINIYSKYLSVKITVTGISK